MRCLVFIACVAVLAFSVPLSAQDPQPDDSNLTELVKAIGQLKRDRPLRIHTSQLTEITGYLIDSRSDSIFLSLGTRDTGLALEDVQGLWEQGRATKKGLFIGGISLSIAGGVLGVFAAGFARMESSEDVSSFVGFLGGAALGFAGGGLLGAGVGAAINQWHLKYRSIDYRSPVGTIEPDVGDQPDSTSSAPGGYPAPRLGGLTFQVGVTADAHASGNSVFPGGRLGLVAQLGSRLTAGPEFGYFRSGGDQSFLNAGAVFRLGKAQGSKYFYGLFCLGLSDYTAKVQYWDYYSEEWFDDHTGHFFVGYGLGAGMLIGSGQSPIIYGVEARWQSNFSRIGGDGPLSYLSLTGTLKYAW